VTGNGVIIPGPTGTRAVAQLLRDEVALAYNQAGDGDPALVLVHGLSCHRGFWTAQLTHFAASHRVLAIDLRGHGDSDTPRQHYTSGGCWAALGCSVRQLVARADRTNGSAGGRIGEFAFVNQGPRACACSAVPA
jgi:pimeloyl-ACP methyl ester carboxylesterase